MADVTITDMQTSITFEPETVVGRAPQGMLPEGGDVDALRRILRPIIVELLADELDQHMRMRG